MNQQESWEEYEVLISGHLDGELDVEEQRRFDALMASSPAFRREYEHMKRLVEGTSHALRAEDVPPEMWDDFLDSVYNRMERKAGWLVLIVGALCLAAYGMAYYILAPWAALWVKILLALPAAGLFILFVSVLRQRLRIAKNDRYSREVWR